ncbi:hypothetical protein D9M72_482850 [compost metagenome]
MLPAGSSCTRIVTRTSATPVKPAVSAQLLWIWPFTPSISLALRPTPTVFLPPSAASCVERFLPPADGSCRLRRAAISSALNLLSSVEACFFCSFGVCSSLRSGVFALWAGFSTFGFAAGVGTFSGKASASGFSAGFSSAGAGSGFVSGFTSCFGSGSAATSVAGSEAGLLSSTFLISCSTGSGVGSGFSFFSGEAVASLFDGLAFGVGGVFRSVSLSPTFSAGWFVSGRLVGTGEDVSFFGAFLSPCWTCVISE